MADWAPLNFPNGQLTAEYELTENGDQTRQNSNNRVSSCSSCLRRAGSDLFPLLPLSRKKRLTQHDAKTPKYSCSVKVAGPHRPTAPSCCLAVIHYSRRTSCSSEDCINARSYRQRCEEPSSSVCLASSRGRVHSPPAVQLAGKHFNGKQTSYFFIEFIPTANVWFCGPRCRRQNRSQWGNISSTLRLVAGATRGSQNHGEQ